MADIKYRYRAGANVAPAFGPPHAVLDDQEQEAIALCWHPEKAQLIVDVLNLSLPLPEKV
jgi:hypothetical protein